MCVGGVCICAGVVYFMQELCILCRSCVCTLLFRLEIGETKIPPVMVTWSLGYLKVFVSYGKMACHLQALRIISETISHFGCYMYIYIYNHEMTLYVLWHVSCEVEGVHASHGVIILLIRGLWMSHTSTLVFKF